MRLGGADQIARTIGRALRDYFALLDSEEPLRRRNDRPLREHWIGEVENLGSVDRILAADEDQHVARRDDSLLAPSSALLRGTYSHHLVRSHQRTLDLVNRRTHVIRDRRQARAGKAVRSLLDRLRPGHL